MNILPEIANRRSVRKYNDRDISDEQIAALIESARLAPSGSNKQPWDFLVIRSKELHEKISAIDHDQKWMLTAPVFIVCIGNERYRGDGDMERVIRDSAIATEHILLQAEHMGLATCWTGWYDQQEMRELLGLDDCCYVIGVVTVGYSDEKPAARPRRKIEYKTLYEPYVPERNQLHKYLANPILVPYTIPALIIEKGDNHTLSTIAEK